MEGIPNPAKLQVLTNDQVDTIHETSLTILGTTGVRFDSEKAVELLLKYGATPHPTRKNVLTFERGLVEDSIRKIPFYGKYFARDPKNDITFDGEHTFAHSLGGNPNMLDVETGLSRSATLKDVAECTRVMDALENCHSVSGLVVATDVPAPLLVARTMEAMMKNSTKCLSGYALREEEVDVQVKMWACVAGGEEELRKRPLFTLYGSPTSPLTYDRNVCEVMIRSAGYGISVDLVPCPIAGGTAPLTLAAGLALQNAEVLAGVMLFQTVDHRLPVQYSGRLSLLDLRSVKNLWGMPEMGLTSAATVQIAHRYHMTADVYGVTTDANGWDMQIGLERMTATIPPALAGADNLSGIGGAWENASSLEMLVIDNEIYADVFRMIRGLELDEERLALDIIEKVGPGGNFLAQRHTMKYLKLGEIRNSALWDKRTMDRAVKDGIRPIQDVARQAARKILAEHEPTPLDRDVEKDVAAVIKGSEKQLLAAY
ncbi:MAG: hypothetical protein A3K66_01185 [Euryarchaeota archaeon RBG_16_67_27]|nr:MAG: hypothetical protein A3K66_01185 [Euryarchaeota archaeon RBG_16_67_27]